MVSVVVHCGVWSHLGVGLECTLAWQVHQAIATVVVGYQAGTGPG
jgi:hypothetical protein